MKSAFFKSLPVLCGYVFLGIAFGILLEQAGYNALWAFFISLFVYAGSFQFVLVPLLASGASLVTAAVTALFVNSRHIFYGLSFLKFFRAMGKRFPYMVFSLTDETYSVLCSCREEENTGEWFLIALFNHCYWIAGSVIGAVAGQLIPFDFTGIDFSMTALFAVILLNQILDAKRDTRLCALGGLLSGVVCLLLFSPDRFLLPALLLAVCCTGAISRVGAPVSKTSVVPAKKNALEEKEETHR